MRAKSLLVNALFAVIAATTPALARQVAQIPPGTPLQVRITENLSSANARVGQLFHGVLQAPIVANGRTLYPKSSSVTGKIVGVHRSGRLSDPGLLELVLTSVTSGNSSSALSTQAFRIKGESHTKANLEKIGGSAAAGAIIGAIVDGGKGAAIGAGVGAATGTGIAAATGRKEAKVESEAVLQFVTAGNSNVASAQPAPVGRQVQPAYRDDDEQPVYRRRHGDEDDDDRDDDRYRRRDDDDDQGYDRGRRDSEYYVQAFSDDDRRIIRSCYTEDYSNLPPGLAKRGGNFPPGLERHLQRNGTLPSGLQKRVQPLPGSCVRQLPPIPSGWMRVVLSGRILLLDGGYRIMDMFYLHGD